MKIQGALVGGLLVLAVPVALYLYLQNPASEVTELKTESQFTEQVVAEELASNVAIDDENSEAKRREKMINAYSDLAQARRALKSRVNMLKSLSWGINLPSAQAKQISHTMREVFVYLKNPPMLGAYFELAEITRESRKIDSMVADLEKAELVLHSARESQVSGQ